MKKNKAKPGVRLSGKIVFSEENMARPADIIAYREKNSKNNMNKFLSGTFVSILPIAKWHVWC